MNPWWTQQTGILIGAIGGSALGTLGGVLGALAGILVPRGIGKRFVLPAFGVLAALGVVALAAGIIAWLMGQPYFVFFPLIALGLIMALVMGGLLPVMAAVYRKAEARRMHAEDLRRG
jgi:hypothetical protein